jgi:hypothetical protein
MTKTIINNSHYDYANNIVKLLGFDNLIDYVKIIKYANLKLDQVIICENFTKTVPDFKILFPLSKFDLRKHNYVFSNIDQVIGFFKKIMLYLSIPIDKVRIGGQPCLRLKMINNIMYINYINKMAENPQNSPYVTNPEKPVTQYNNFSTILEKYRKKPIEKSYIIPCNSTLDNFENFAYFISMKIAIFDNGNITKLLDQTTIEFIIGGNPIVPLHTVINNDTTFDDNYVTISIDFPNNLFYKYHCLNMSITSPTCDKNTLYQIIITGNEFKPVPQSVCDSAITYNHDNKYYVENDYKYISLNGMVGSIEIHKPIEPFFREPITTDNSRFETMYKQYESNNQISREQFTIPSSTDNLDHKLLIINNASDDLSCDAQFEDYLLENPQNISICSNFYTNIPMMISENINDDKVSIFYDIARCGDMLRSIEILNIFQSVFEYTIEIGHLYHLTSCGTYQSNMDHISKFILLKDYLSNTYFNLINKSCIRIYFKITTDKKNIKEFLNLNVKLGYVRCYMALRRKLAVIPP